MRIFFILFTMLSVNAFAQQKNVEKIIGPGFLKNVSYEKYRFNEKDPGVQIIPSDTYVGDTSGIVFKNEFVNFRFNLYPDYADEITYYHTRPDSVDGKRVLFLTPIDTVIPPPSLLRYIKTEPVTVAEYLEFQNWVRDSITREILYMRLENDKEAARYINYEKTYFNEITLESETFEFADRKMNRELFSLNWKTPVNYNEFAPLKELYLEPNERFAGKLKIDERKLIYRYSEISKITSHPFEAGDRGHQVRERLIAHYTIPTLIDTYSWMKHAPALVNEFLGPPDAQNRWNVISQGYLEQFPNLPITGITGMQARAYCDWKEKQLQAEIDRKNLPYTIEISLPAVTDLDRVRSGQPVIIPAYDPTENWQITTVEYQEFLRSVQDSVLNECLYQAIFHTKDAEKLLKGSKISVDTNFLSQVNSKAYKDSLFRERYFPLSYNHSVQRKYKTVVDSIKKTTNYRIPAYKHVFMSASERMFRGELEASEDKTLQVKPMDTIPYLSGKDLNLGMVNNRGQSSGVRSHAFIGQFFVEDEICIVPEIPLTEQKPNELVKGITYEQALAYYHWKYPITKAKSTDDWQQFVFPDKEEFERIKKGEEINLQKIQVDFPSPLFRYVIHLTPFSEDE
ncbi:MAG: hypothetical protein ACO1N0_21510 [Fluviicola sp.]